MNAPPSFNVTPAGAVTAVSGTVANISQDMHLFKLGVNYRFGRDSGSPGAASEGSPFARTWHRPGGLEAEFGGRSWYSTGKFQWDNFASSDVLKSRLTYAGLRGHSGEFFGRVDAPFNVFVKGLIGAGSIVDGTLNDEDWGLPIGAAIAYSNTISNEKDGYLKYGTVDVGYDLWRSASYKVGPFVGYNLYREKVGSFGCVQIANPAFPCLAPADEQIVGTQKDQWQSLRVGGSAEVKFTRNLKINGDVAYLPYVSFDGRDDHLLRTTPTHFDQEGTGRGVQLEAILSYDVSPQFSLGVGGRYWGMWTTDGTFTCTGCGGAGVTSSPPNPSRNSTNRYGLLLQGSYKFATDDRVPLK